MSAASPAIAAPAAGSFTAEVFAAHLASQSALPAWWLDLKKAAWNQFNALPMPKRTDELWRFSNVAALKLDNFTLPTAVERVVPDQPPFQHAASLTFANNRLLAPTLLPPELAKKGVLFEPLESAVLKHGDLLRKHFMAHPANLGSEKFNALHAALTTSGALLYVPKGVEIPAPIVITHCVSGAGAAVFPHTLVIADDNAKVTVVEFLLSVEENGGEAFLSAEALAKTERPGSRGPKPLPHFSSGVNDLHAGPGAQLTYLSVQNWSRESLAFQSNSTIVQRDARVLSLNVHLGGRQARHESHSRLIGPGAHSEMLALTVAQGAQEFDQRTLQSHLAPHTSSNLLYKNALLDTAKTIFSGLIIVDPEAQQTDAYQSNRNLLLSPEAEANSLPGLEIQANDVRCTHGATSGHVDDEQMFYLESRGVRPAVAKELLVFGFFEEVLGQLASDELHDALRALIQAKFKK